jgi:biopolymer transport protein ExbD
MGMAVKEVGGLNNEPNLVPMIDVLLVLLVIFMLMIPMNRRVIDIQMPDPIPRPDAVPDDKQIVLEVIPGDFYKINTLPVPKAALEQRLHQIYDPRPDKIIFVKGDTTVTYQEVLSAMDVARGSGVKVIGIPPKETKRTG